LIDTIDLLQAEAFFARIAEKTFLQGDAASGLSNLSGPDDGPGKMKMVNGEFVRHALHLAHASQQVLGNRHWIVKWAHIFVIDLVLTRLENSLTVHRKLIFDLLLSLRNLWKWLESLDFLHHGPECFIGTRIARVQKLINVQYSDNPHIRNLRFELDDLLPQREQHVEIIPMRTLLIAGTVSFG